MKNPKFQIKKDKAGEFRFALKAGNGEIILNSEGYKAMSSCTNGIASVQKNCGDEDRYEKKEAKNGKFYFVLKASNGQVIGQSEMYNSSSGRNNGIKSVMKNGVIDRVEDIS